MLRNSISIRNSVEGPRHDPYGVTTINFKKSDDHVITLRQGSLTGDTLYVNGTEVSKSLEGDETRLMFENMAGFSCSDANRLMWEAGIRITMNHGKMNRAAAIDMMERIEHAESRAYYM